MRKIEANKKRPRRDCFKVFILDKTGDYERAGFSRSEAKLPKRKSKDIYGILPESRAKEYDMKEILNCLLDNSEFEEY